MVAMICVCFLAAAGVLLLLLAVWIPVLFPQPMQGGVILKVSRKELPNLEQQLRGYRYLRGCGLLCGQVFLVTEAECREEARQFAQEFDFVSVCETTQLIQALEMEKEKRAT